MCGWLSGSCYGEERWADERTGEGITRPLDAFPRLVDKFMQEGCHLLVSRIGACGFASKRSTNAVLSCRRGGQEKEVKEQGMEGDGNYQMGKLGAGEGGRLGDKGSVRNAAPFGPFRIPYR